MVIGFLLVKMKWLISDTHLFHPIVLQQRGYTTIDEMNDDIIRMWKDTVQPSDTVFHLGDFAFGTDLSAIENIIKDLPGKVTLLVGNHDTPVKCAIYAKYWKLASTIKYKDIVLSHVPLHPTSIYRDTLIGNIHGHIHNACINDVRYMNVNFDVLTDKKIVSLTECRQKLHNISYRG